MTLYSELCHFPAIHRWAVSWSVKQGPRHPELLGFGGVHRESPTWSTAAWFYPDGNRPSPGRPLGSGPTEMESPSVSPCSWAAITRHTLQASSHWLPPPQPLIPTSSTSFRWTHSDSQEFSRRSKKQLVSGRAGVPGPRPSITTLLVQHPDLRSLDSCFSVRPMQSQTSISHLTFCTTLYHSAHWHWNYQIFRPVPVRIWEKKKNHPKYLTRENLVQERGRYGGFLEWKTCSRSDEAMQNKNRHLWRGMGRGGVTGT